MGGGEREAPQKVKETFSTTLTQANTYSPLSMNCGENKTTLWNLYNLGNMSIVFTSYSW